MENFDLSDTIAAQITPVGNGSVAVIRLSGKEAINIANTLFSKELRNAEPNQVIFGKLKDEEKFIDEVLTVIMKAPHSFTGEDVVEFQCHGSQLIVKEILYTLTKKKARLAKPGEFSFRAFIHGKMDLIKAESISEMIQAKSQKALHLAKKHLKGDLNSVIEKMQQDLLNIAAQTEAFIDFPEEDLDFSSNKQLDLQLSDLMKQMEELTCSFDQGKKISTGIKVALVGAPNAGKSSLMNALLKENRVIVTEIPGTTRDIIAEEIDISGYLVRLIDTAGIRKTEDKIERIGIEKSMEIVEEADFILLIIDGSIPLDCKIKELSTQLPEDKTLCVFNKCDLSTQEQNLGFDSISISAKKGFHIDQLIKKLIKKIESQLPDREETMLSSMRHKELLEKALTHLKSASSGFKASYSYEFICLDLRIGLDALFAISGKKMGEKIIDTIFSKFCLGK